MTEPQKPETTPPNTITEKKHLKKKIKDIQTNTIQPTRLRSLLKNMIDIYSPHGKEKEICDFLYHYLKKHGLPVIRQYVEEDRENILVIPDVAEPQLVLLGHIDTVPAPDFENYKYHITSRDRDTINGLGAADMKGGCAAMIEAYIHQWHQHPNHLPAALALVVGEESNGDGTTTFLSEYSFPYAIVGEPTNLTPCFSHYGYIEANISTRGKRIHASLASAGINAIEVMMHQLLKIMDYLKTHRPEVIYNIRNLSSSHTGFVVPEYCEVFIDFHVPPHSAIDNIIYELEDLFAKEEQGKSDFNAAIHFTYIHAGYDLPEKGKFYDTLQHIYQTEKLPFEPGSFRSHSDANLLWAAGIRPLLIGPGQLEVSHMPDEFVPFQQVLQATHIYRHLLESLT